MDNLSVYYTLPSPSVRKHTTSGNISKLQFTFPYEYRIRCNKLSIMSDDGTVPFRIERLVTIDFVTSTEDDSVRENALEGTNEEERIPLIKKVTDDWCIIGTILSQSAGQSSSSSVASDSGAIDSYANCSTLKGGTIYSIAYLFNHPDEFLDWMKVWKNVNINTLQE